MWTWAIETLLFLPFFALRCRGHVKTILTLMPLFVAVNIIFHLCIHFVGFAPVLDPCFWIFWAMSNGHYSPFMHLWALFLILGPWLIDLPPMLEALVKQRKSFSSLRVQ